MAFAGWSNELFFIKDPLVVVVYLYALHSGMRPQLSSFLIAAGAFAVAAVILIVNHLLSVPGYTWTLAAYGFRSYFLFVPLAFLIAKYFRRRDIDRLFLHSFVAVVPVAALVYVQYSSPLTAAVNAGANGDFVNPLVGVTVRLVRTYGPFTSSEAQNFFSVSVLAMLMIGLLRPTGLKSGTKGGARMAGLLLVTGAVAVCVGLSGSRGAVLWSALVISSSVAALLLSGGFHNVARGFALIAGLLPVAAVAIASIFPLAVEAFTERWIAADLEESSVYQNGVYGRAAGEVFVSRALLAHVPILGHGFGTGGNAASVLNDNGQFSRIKDGIRLSTRDQLAGAEQDWGRHILDFGPFIGVAFIAFRIAFAAWLCREALRATRRCGDPGPMIMAVFSGLLLYQGHIVALGTGQAYAWLFVGLTIAMCNVPANVGLPGAKQGVVTVRPIQIGGRSTSKPIAKMPHRPGSAWPQ